MMLIFTGMTARILLFVDDITDNVDEDDIDYANVEGDNQVSSDDGDIDIGHGDDDDVHDEMFVDDDNGVDNVEDNDVIGGFDTDVNDDEDDANDVHHNVYDD